MCVVDQASEQCARGRVMAVSAPIAREPASVRSVRVQATGSPIERSNWEKHLVSPPIRDRDGRVFRRVHPVGLSNLVGDSDGHRACLFR